MPATYVVNTDGVIVHAFVNVDHTQREDPEKIVAVLKQLQVAASGCRTIGAQAVCPNQFKVTLNSTSRLGQGA